MAGLGFSRITLESFVYCISGIEKKLVTDFRIHTVVWHVDFEFIT